VQNVLHGLGLVILSSVPSSVVLFLFDLPQALILCRAAVILYDLLVFVWMLAFIYGIIKVSLNTSAFLLFLLLWVSFCFFAGAVPLLFGSNNRLSRFPSRLFQ
jgi:hypothetical protein